MFSRPYTTLHRITIEAVDCVLTPSTDAQGHLHIFIAPKIHVFPTNTNANPLFQNAGQQTDNLPATAVSSTAVQSTSTDTTTAQTDTDKPSENLDTFSTSNDDTIENIRVYPDNSVTERQDNSHTPITSKLQDTEQTQTVQDNDTSNPDTTQPSQPNTDDNDRATPVPNLIIHETTEVSQDSDQDSDSDDCFIQRVSPPLNKMTKPETICLTVPKTKAQLKAFTEGAPPQILLQIPYGNQGKSYTVTAVQETHNNKRHRPRDNSPQPSTSTGGATTESGHSRKKRKRKSKVKRTNHTS